MQVYARIIIKFISQKGLIKKFISQKGEIDILLVHDVLMAESLLV